MAKTTSSKNNESNLNTIKTAIVYAHDVLHNSRAIGKAEVESCGISEQAVNQWKAYVEDLQAASNNYLDLAHDADTDAKTLQVAQGRVWSEWRRVLKQGTEQEFDSRFFIRKDDLVHICGLCGETFMNTARGKNLCHTKPNDFRKNIETLIGIRLTGNGMISDDDRDTIQGYERALKTIKTCEDALKGTKDPKGKKIAGLRDNLKAAKASLKENEELAETLELDDEKKELFLSVYQDRAEALKAEIETTEKKLKEAKDTKEETEEAYEKVMLTLRIAGAES